jgi:hypothetical protein
VRAGGRYHAQPPFLCDLTSHKQARTRIRMHIFIKHASAFACTPTIHILRTPTHIHLQQRLYLPTVAPTRSQTFTSIPLL